MRAALLDSSREPSTASRSVLDARTSPRPASALIRALMWTLAGVQSGAHVDADLARRSRDRVRAAHGLGGFTVRLRHRASVEGDLVDSQVDGRVVVEPRARLERSTVRGPAIIGAGARLIDAYIGPYTAIGAARLQPRWR